MLTELLRGDVAQGVLTDVADLLDARSLGAVLQALANIAAGTCEP